jgi:hypothetical protein
MFKVLMKISWNLENAVVSAESHSWNKQLFEFLEKNNWDGAGRTAQNIPV